MKQAKWLAIGLIGILVLVRSLSAAWALLNVPSDAAAWVAILCLVAIVLGGVMLGGVWWRRRPFVALLVLLAASQLTGCTRIGPGHVGIVVNMAGGSKGVQDYPARTGWVFYNPVSESVMEYPTFIQSFAWTGSKDEGHPVNEELTFTNSDQMQIAADVSIGYQLIPEMVPQFYVKFRNDQIDAFTHGYLRNIAREKLDRVAGKYKIEQIMGDNSGLLDEWRKDLQGAVGPFGVQIEQLGFIGAPRPPASVIEAINQNNRAMQLSRQKQNELAQVQADAAKVIAEAEGSRTATLISADADAKYNRLLAESLTPLLVQNRMISKWNGQMPQVSTGQGGMMPLITLK